MDKMTYLHELEQMRKAVSRASMPNHYISDVLGDVFLVLKYGMTKFLWCLRECGTFIIALNSEKQVSEFDIEYDAVGMKQYPEARFFIIDDDVEEPYEITYEKAMEKIDEIQEGLKK